MDEATRDGARETLSSLFSNLGRARQNNDPGLLGGLGGGLAEDLQEFMTMPMDLAVVFLNMSVELAELVLKSLEEAGYTLTKGLTPL